MFDLLLSSYGLILNLLLDFRSGWRSDCSGHCIVYVQVIPMYRYELLYLSLFALLLSGDVVIRHFSVCKVYYIIK